MIRIIVFTCVALLMLSPSTASAQFLLFWDTEDGNWNVPENWFGDFGPPDAGIGDIGVVNRGLSFLDAEAATPTGGLILGEGGSDNGTLHIRNGGELVAIEETDVNGAVRVGQAGTGTLIVDRGGSLEALSLRAGGNDASAIILGGGSSGSTSVTIDGPAVLARNTHVIGSNVNFEAETLSLSGNLVAEIAGEQHSTLSINDAATLGGNLDLQFVAPFQPAPGQTWNLVDADSITGSFANVTSNVSPGPGLAFSVSTVEGGQNGMVAQLGIDARLQLSVNRRTGASVIQNLAEQQAVTINGYGVGSESGILSSDNWRQLESGGPWAGNGSATHVSEISLEGSHEIGPGGEVDLGNVYAFEPSALGESNEDVFFEYHVAGGDVAQGLVNFTGPHNDLVLVVGEDGAYIQNQSTSDITINGYAILSEAGSLDPDDWTSLADSDDAWRKANAANNHLTELNLSETMTIGATSAGIPLGPIVADGANDLVFVVNMPESGPYTGTVEYDDGLIDFGGGLLGDCDGDGDLDAADLACVSTLEERDAVLGALGTLPGDLNGDGAVAFVDFVTLSTNFGQSQEQRPLYTDGNIDLVNGVDFADFVTLSTNFGQQPAAVPEPTGLAWPLIGALLFLIRRRR